MSLAISSTTTSSSSSLSQAKQTPKLPDDFYETKYTTLEDLPAEDTDSEPATVWGVLNLSTGTVTIYNGGVSRYTPYEMGGDVSQWGNDIDWENLNTPEEVADAIMSKYGGKLTASSVESGKKSLTTELMSKMFSSDALVNRMFLTEDGGSIEDGLAKTDEDSSSTATAAAGDLQAVQTQAAAV